MNTTIRPFRPRSSRLRRPGSTLVALLLATGLVLWPGAPPAAAAVLFGHDISWPQCTVAEGGYGLPMPPTTTQFVIIGLTKGLPFTENPCLDRQHQWVVDRGKPAHAYTMAAYPTPAQLSAYGGAGPWSASTKAGRLSNVGYAEAAFAVASLDDVGWAAPMVWIDVEPRPAQPWPTGSVVRQFENRFVIEGLMRGLRDHGISYGLYSYATGWAEITGAWRLPGVPVWATAGRLDYPTEALDRCRQPSFSGGKVYLSQWYDDTRDYDRTCEPYAFTKLPVPRATLSNSTADFNGSWKNDLLARRSAGGTVTLFPGNGTGGLGAGIRITADWSKYDVLETVGDFSGDGLHDVLAREKATGYLYLYKGDGRGGWRLPRVQVGAGWNGMNAIVGAGDLDGDERMDVVARRASTGELFLYPGTGTGAFKPRVRIATQWSGYDLIIGPGDLTGNMRADLLTRERSTGYLWLHPGNGTGKLASRIRIGTGWGSLTAVMSPGDFTGDRIVDLLARDRSGNLWLYPRTSTAWKPRILLGTGWNSFNRLF